MDELTHAFASTDDRFSAPLRQALFGTAPPERIARLVGDVVANSLAPVATVQFVHSGVGLVVGATLRDGCAVVVKVHRWNVTHERLLAVQQVQGRLADDGLPAPRPLLPPTPLASGIATVEELRAGGPVDGHAPRIRAAVAAGLAAFVDVAGRMEPVPAVGHGALAFTGDGVWAEPHDVRFDFEATAAGAEWIDELAQHARRQMARFTLPDVVAHLDWRVENLGFSGNDITAIYDWDSVGLVPEPVAVGQAAAQFSTDWRIGYETLPSLAEMRSFVHDYEMHRRAPFDAHERVLLDGANLLLCAYGARCQHSDRTLSPEAAGALHSGWGRLLRERGTEGLR